MTADRTIHVSTFTEDDDGWAVVSCSCGFKFGPLPDMETAADVWGDHRADTAADPAPTDCTCVAGQGCDAEGDPGCSYCQTADPYEPCPAEDQP